jgi:hypothetical protein
MIIEPSIKPVATTGSRGISELQLTCINKVEPLRQHIADRINWNCFGLAPET